MDDRKHYGGWGGIRTHETLQASAGFQDQCLRPLGHPSVLQYAILLLLAGFVAGCAGDGKPSPDTMASGAGGHYKIGNPYEIKGRTYRPRKNTLHYEEGVASWYGRQFHGKETANGEIFDMNKITAAHRTLPLPSYVRVTNLENSRTLIVRVNDRGPFAKNRVIDLSKKSAEILGFLKAGTARVRVEYEGRARIPKSLPPLPPLSPGPARAEIKDGCINSEGANRVYLVQAGVFSSAERARENGYQAASEASVDFSVREMQKDGRTLYRTLLGPFLDSLIAESVCSLIRARGYADAFVRADRVN